MGTQGTGRKRNSNKERSTAEDDALNLIAREAEARLAAKRAARAEAREIRMRELERQQKEIFQVQKKYYGLNSKSDDRSDSKWGDIEQWMEDSERYSRPSQTHMLSDDDERMSVGSRGSVRSDLDAVYGAGGSSLLLHKSKKKKKHKHKEKDRNGHDDEYSVLSNRNSLYEDTLCSGSRRFSGSNSGSHPLEYSSYRRSNSRTSSRANSAHTSPVDNCGSVASLLRSASSSRGLPRDLDDVTVPDFSDVDDRDYLEKGSRAASALTATTLTSLGGTSSRRGSVETAITVDAETATREIKEIHELKDQIQDVESKYTQNLKEVKDALTEVEEKYRKAMVSNAQLDNEKNNLMYQVDTLKDSLIELEELLCESRREYEEKVKDFEREKHAHSVLQFQFIEMKDTLKQSEELLNEIRQLRMKQEGFAREISDLQETVEWKDKKIGALERQKEYTDAIRTERDELREEVVKLKDILKKHGIVLGPDLSINGDAGETETDVTTSGDTAPQPTQGSPTSPPEGNNMLGRSEETQLRSSGKEEVDQEQRREVFEEDQTSHLSADRLSNTDEPSRPIKENDSGLSQDLQIELPVTKARDEIVLSAIIQGNATSPPETLPRFNSDLETGTQINDGDIEENSNDIIEKPNKHDTNEDINVIKLEPIVQAVKDSESCPQEEDIEDNETSCQVDVNESESCTEEETNEIYLCTQVNIKDSESLPQEDIKDSESCPKEDLTDSQPCPNVQGAQDPETCLQDVKVFESHPQEEDIKDQELCCEVAAKDSASCPQEDVQDSKSYAQVDVKEFESCPQEDNLKDPESCPQVDVKDCELLRQDSVQDFYLCPQVDVKDSESCPQEDIKDSESFPKEDLTDSEPSTQVQGVKNSESCDQIDVKDSESHPQVEDKKDPESCLQVGVKGFESHPQDIIDPELCHQLEAKDSESCPLGYTQNSKSYHQVDEVKDFELYPQKELTNPESYPEVDVKANELCPQEGIQNFDLCLKVDVKDLELYPPKDLKNPESYPEVDMKDTDLCTQEGIQDFDLCLQVDVKDSESHPQEDIKDPESCAQEGLKNSESCSQEDINDSKSCPQVLVVKDSEPCPQAVDPESNTELQHDTAEASSDEAEKILTKPPKSAKKKKRKRRGKKKGGFLEEQTQHRDKKEETVTNQENIKIAGRGVASGNNGSAAECGTDGHTIECLIEYTAGQVDVAEQVEHAETSNVQNAKESQLDQMFNTDEQNVQHLGSGKVQIDEPEAFIQTFSLTLPLIQTETDQNTNKPKQSLESLEVQEGCIKRSESEVVHSGVNRIFNSESRDKDSSLDYTTNVAIPSQGGTSPSGVVHNEGEISSETTNCNKDSVPRLDVESHGQIPHVEPSECQNHVSVMFTHDIGDSLQDPEWSPSEPTAAVNSDTLIKVSENVLEKETFTKQEHEEPEVENVDRSRKECKELFNLVKLENSSCDLDREQILVETQPEIEKLMHEDQVVEAASDTKVQTSESEEARCEVSNDELAPAEEPMEHESSQGVQIDEVITGLGIYLQDSGEDFDDEDEKGHSFDFDDMDIDAAMETQSDENLEQREVEAGFEEVRSDEHNADINSNIESPKDREVSTDVATPENPEHLHVEVPVEEVLSGEHNTINNSNIENLQDKEVCTHVATPDNGFKHNLVDVESSPEHLRTVDDKEPSNTGVSETTDKDKIPPRATSLPVEEALDAIEKPIDLNATHSNREMPLSGKDGKKNGKKGKSKGKDDCKMT
ncbi:myosin-2 heavy chain isoform X8 [Phyllopteryx taeniolatus]|uniref:myosin-2 heavy chain isoform X8 n=1 Tax=Phyllopteryx taeniolatus TaxID=161469 RepID=UPI002AD2D468|nr:myosin-2 heavy chain isoform X8 [Phyllopteryx taeniolatus]